MLSPELDKLLKRTQLELLDGRFVLLGFPAEQTAQVVREFELLNKFDQPFMMLRDEREFTVLLREEVWTELRSRITSDKIEIGFRVITLDVELAWNVVGYLARVTEVLAKVGVSVGVLSAFSRDHLVIRETDLKPALETLADLFDRRDQGGADGV